MINSRHVRQIICFGMVGIAATAVHYLVALAAIERAGFGVYWANTFGYGCALCISYFGHGLLTFRAHLNRLVFLRFAFVSVSTFIGSGVLLTGLEEILHLRHRLAIGAVVCFVPAVSFLLNKFWVYKIKSA